MDDINPVLQQVVSAPTRSKICCGMARILVQYDGNGSWTRILEKHVTGISYLCMYISLSKCMRQPNVYSSLVNQSIAPACPNGHLSFIIYSKLYYIIRAFSQSVCWNWHLIGAGKTFAFRGRYTFRQPLFLDQKNTSKLIPLICVTIIWLQ